MTVTMLLVNTIASCERQALRRETPPITQAVDATRMAAKIRMDDRTAIASRSLA
jgi:hypothetical protein